MQDAFDWYLNRETSSVSVQYDNVFTDEELQKIIELGDNLPIEEAAVGQGDKPVTMKSVRKTSLTFIPVNTKSEWLFRKLTDVIVDANNNFFHLDILKIQTLQYSIYNVGDFYDTHVDTQTVYFDGVRKISFSLQLTDDEEYEGGNLLLIKQPNPKPESRKKGVITFFNSMLAHEVTPVISGTRKALVGWILGPAFK